MKITHRLDSFYLNIQLNKIYSSMECCTCQYPMDYRRFEVWSSHQKYVPLIAQQLYVYKICMRLTNINIGSFRRGRCKIIEVNFYLKNVSRIKIRLLFLTLSQNLEMVTNKYFKNVVYKCYII